MEKTLVILKPCVIQRGLIGEVISRFEKKGLRLTALKMYQFTEEKCAEHYQHLIHKPFYPIIKQSMMASPVILCCWEGIDAVEVVRQLTGSTNSREAAPGTIRGDFSMSHQENVIHSSDSKENAEIELNRFFSAEDYFQYPFALHQFLYAEDEL